MFYSSSGNLVKIDANYYRGFKDNIDLWPSSHPQIVLMRDSSTRVPSIEPSYPQDPDILRIKKSVNKLKNKNWKPKKVLKPVRFEQKKQSEIKNYINYVWRKASLPLATTTEILPNIKIPSLSIQSSNKSSVLPYGNIFNDSVSPLSIPTRSASLTSYVEGFVSPVSAAISQAASSISGNNTWSSVGQDSVFGSNSPRSVRSGYYDYRGIYNPPPILRKITPPPLTPPESLTELR